MTRRSADKFPSQLNAWTMGRRWNRSHFDIETERKNRERVKCLYLRIKMPSVWIERLCSCHIGLRHHSLSVNASNAIPLHSMSCHSQPHFFTTCFDNFHCCTAVLCTLCTCLNHEMPVWCLLCVVAAFLFVIKFSYASIIFFSLFSLHTEL